MHVSPFNLILLAIAGGLLCACAPPRDEDAERVIRNWYGALPEDRKTIDPAWPQFECSLNTITPLDRAQPMNSVADDVPRWGFSRNGPDRLQLRAPDMYSAKEALYDAYTGPDRLLVDQCIRVPTVAGPTAPERNSNQC